MGCEWRAGAFVEEGRCKVYSRKREVGNPNWYVVKSLIRCYDRFDTKSYDMGKITLWSDRGGHEAGRDEFKAQVLFQLFLHTEFCTRVIESGKT